MKSCKKGRPMRQLEVINHSSREGDDYHKKLLKMINECDGAVMVLQKDRRLYLKYFGLHSEEIIHALEWGKLKIFDEEMR